MYIQCTQLMPGDIILSTEKSLVSEKIAKKTGGEFSHSSLLVTRLLQIEAVRKGIKISAISPILKCSSSGRVLWKIKDDKKVKILRLKYEYKIPVEHVGNAFCELALSYSGLPYSHYSRLINVKDISIKRKYWLDKFIRLFSKLDGNDKKSKLSEHDRAYFCSELVASFFETLGMSLFDDKTVPEDISPNYFLNSDKLFDVTNECIDDREYESLTPFSLQKNDQLEKFLKKPEQFAKEFSDFSDLLQRGISTLYEAGEIIEKLSELSDRLPSDLESKLASKKKRLISLSDDMQSSTLSTLRGWPRVQL